MSSFLPDKKPLSYHLFMFLILRAFNKSRELIKKLTNGLSFLKLKRIKSDYEHVNIHNLIK